MPMRHAPSFWSDSRARTAPRLLAPIERVVSAVATRRATRPRWHAPVPVLCCGNATVGGTGKTTLAIDMAQRLLERGRTVHILTRGYGGRTRQVVRVDPASHSARDVGDEALLLAATAPTWIAADRAAGARAAVAEGADCLVLDDGFQNTSLFQDMPLLVIDGASGFGNGHVLPAGPLREPLDQAFARARAVVMIGADRHRVTHSLPPDLPVLHARLQPEGRLVDLVGQQVIAFAGIGRPGKFFDSLRDAGIAPVRTIAYPDHHAYSRRDLLLLDGLARQRGTVLVTTPKDAVRLPDEMRARVKIIGTSLKWESNRAADMLLDCLLDGLTTRP